MKIVSHIAIFTSYVIWIIGSNSDDIPKAVSASWLIAILLVCAIVFILEDK